jgi:DNA-binding NtrC family response regulator
MMESPLSGLLVLVVEDEYLIALEAQRIIEEAGATQVMLANSIAEVRRLLVGGPTIDAAVLDLKLGSDDASPLIADFAHCNIPFLVTTGLDANVPEGVRRLAKPYREAELIEAILHLTQRD